MSRVALARPGLVALGVLTAGLLAALVACGDGGATPSPSPSSSPTPTAGGTPGAGDFSGELLGLWVAPYGSEAPEGITTAEELCGAASSTAVSWDEAGELFFPEELLDYEQINELNTGVVACGDVVYVAHREYSAPRADGYPSTFIVARCLCETVEVDVPESKVSIAEVAGREAIIVKPEGVGTPGHVVFPEPFGMTHISSNTGIPLEELIAIAEAVVAGLAGG